MNEWSKVDLLVGLLTLLCTGVVGAFGVVCWLLLRAGWRDYHRGHKTAYARGGVLPSPPRPSDERSWWARYWGMP